MIVDNLKSQIGANQINLDMLLPEGVKKIVVTYQNWEKEDFDVVSSVEQDDESYYFKEKVVDKENVVVLMKRYIRKIELHDN